MKKRLSGLADKWRVRDLFTRRLVFSVFALPALINLLLFALIISEGRGFVLGCAGVYAFYFTLNFFFEIKTEKWTVLTLVANALFAILISMFFILAYKLHYLWPLLALEITAAIFLTVIRKRFPHKDSDDEE